MSRCVFTLDACQLWCRVCVLRDLIAVAILMSWQRNGGAGGGVVKAKRNVRIRTYVRWYLRTSICDHGGHYRSAALFAGHTQHTLYCRLLSELLAAHLSLVIISIASLSLSSSLSLFPPSLVCAAWESTFLASWALFPPPLFLSFSVSTLSQLT